MQRAQNIVDAFPLSAAAVRQRDAGAHGPADPAAHKDAAKRALHRGYVAEAYGAFLIDVVESSVPRRMYQSKGGQKYGPEQTYTVA